MQKFIVILFSTFLFLSGWAQQGKSDKVEYIKGKKYYMHTVEKKQTLYNISKLYEVTVNDIVIENPDAIDGIDVGQVLKIPEMKPAAEPITGFSKEDSINFIFYKVESGKTLYSLSKEFELSIDEIINDNPFLNDGLKVGQVIKLKRKTPLPTVANIDTVQIDSTRKDMDVLTDLPLLQVPDSITFMRKPTYNVALILPFNAAMAKEVDADRMIRGDDQFSPKTRVALSFYQGVKVAVDSMQKVGMSVNLYLYDIDAEDSLSLEKLLKNEELKTMDLILGPLYYSHFKSVAKFALENKIHCVSPLSQMNKVLFKNPYASKTVPSSVTQVEVMADHIVKKYKDENIMITTGKYDPTLYAYLKMAMNRQLSELGKDSVIQVSSPNVAAGYLKADKINVLAVPSNDQAYVTNFLTKLNKSAGKFDIQIFGLGSWRSFDNLDPFYLDTLHCHFPSVYFTDYADSSTINFVLKFQEQFNCDPETFAMQGYDVGLFYLQKLFEFGPNFHFKMNGARYEGVQTNFNFYKTVDDGGYDNNSVFILRQEDHRLVIVNDQYEAAGQE